MAPNAWDVRGPPHLTHFERRIYDEILKLRELEKLDPTAVDDDQRSAFLDQFSWENSQLTLEEQAMAERVLVKYHRIFARTLPFSKYLSEF